MRSRRYAYVGPVEIRQRAERSDDCRCVMGVLDLVRWTTNYLRARCERGGVTVTFIIDLSEQLWVADRRSEHVACADGGAVLAAGEMVLDRVGDSVEIAEVTNQSTGYCPEPGCWKVVERVLKRLGVPHPSRWTAAFEFRRCDRCGTTNLIKEEVFECAVCDAPLSKEWNDQGERCSDSRGG